MTSSPLSLEVRDPRASWNHIPAELRTAPQWVGWRFVPRDGAKPTKQPLNPRNGSPASVTDPNTWSTFTEALDCPGASGVGFVFTTDDPYVGIDLDHCRDADTGEVEPWADAIIDRLNTYTEVSPSGTGVHLIVRGNLPPGRRRVGKIEMYSDSRYFTVTGERQPKTPPEIAERTPELRRLHVETFGDVVERESAPTTPIALLSDEEIITKARDAKNGDKFRALWEGDWSSYASQSEGDLALCNHLAFWSGGDSEAVDRIFRRSALFRTKWDEQHGESTYGEMTITKALAGLRHSRPPMFSLTESGNAERLVDRHGADLRYVAGQNLWLTWDGTRWRPDVKNDITQRAKDTVRAMRHEASSSNFGGYSDPLRLWAKQSESLSRLTNMVKLASSDPKIAVLPGDLDADPWLLNVQNGTIDLRNGALRPHRREDLITKIAPVEYDPRARSARWESFLERALPDPEVRGYVQRAVGYSLVGIPSEDVFFFVYGPTRTGKSTFIDALQATLGEYATVADFEAFVKRRDAGGPRNDIARLAGARLVVSIETERDAPIAVSLLKGLTGGDVMTARSLYKESFEFKPQFTLWFAGNHRPNLPDDDSAIWERLREIPFAVSISPEERDPQLKLLLGDPQVSGAAILEWAVQGCLDWQRNRLGTPPAVREATAGYREAMDPLAPFFHACCSEDPEAWTATAVLRGAYEGYCSEIGETPIPIGDFTRRLRARGYEPRQHGQGRVRGWLGISLIDPTNR